ncbi:MFS transporter [Mitsuaria sp. WAJ17]|uniref:MFS transporter n=1 Tax=Mitsuaria sp. WAJ17 TaxID=2761452 RepID=UPI001600360E|nr:MFS transporter [Mitsuaria sp. WAJ17]MBB2483628.1 MFS transporter [Mitsuaria sp. WAJ17]
MLLDLGPLRHNTAFRRLFASQFISGLGTMVSYVAVPWQLYELTRSNGQVGLLGLVQLLPVLLCGLLGGAVADRMDRKRLLIASEALMALCLAGLLANAMSAAPSAGMIYALVAVLQGASGFHRPALEALTQKLARPEEFAAVAALSSVRGTVGMVAGPALAGLLLARWGAVGAYVFDFCTFLAALFFIARIPRAAIGTPASPQERPHLLADLAEGLRFAWRRPELMGTYIVDIVAMAFAFPVALFPAMAAADGRTETVGWLLSAMSVGALLIGVFSGWTGRVRRHGRAVVVAAAVWALGIVALGFAPGLMLGLACLLVAGAADMVSGVFRGTIWNETIPNELRGRLAGIEMISYLTGPLIGNVRAGFMADAWGVSTSVWLGGAICLAGVIATGFALPRFWAYRSAPAQIVKVTPAAPAS